jgi:hypothetical protein
MKSVTSILLSVTILSLAIAVPPPSTLAPQGETIIITSTADSGPGTLRQALLDAHSGDTVTFDPAVFPPSAPVTISVTSALPDIHESSLTIDASNAGVVLDGMNIGATPEVLLLDDVSLALDGGPNLVANGDFGSGLGHWRPWTWDEAPGMTRGVTITDFHTSPQSYQWSAVAHAGSGRTLYDTANTSDPFVSYPYALDSTVWITATGGSTAELRFWYRHEATRVALSALYQDDHMEQLGDWQFHKQAGWTEAVVHRVLPAEVVGVAIEFGYSHSELETNGLSIMSSGNTIRGLQIIGFPNAGVALHDVQDNVIGGDRGVGSGPVGQGNLISGNNAFGVGLWGEDASGNTIQGNIIGTDLSGTSAWGGRRDGIHSNGANHNVIGDNLIGGYTTGVYLCCANNGSNTVRGNYIGTDASGGTGVGNAGPGVAMDRSGHNVIGPDNVVAHNDGAGVAVYGSGALGNRITRNSIHDNGGLGIDQWEGGNTELAAPRIVSFDLEAGTLSGYTCANCTVEVFSDNGDEGATYEGQALAGSAGTFALNKGAAFTGPHLTATTTDTDGDTSKFSAPTYGTRRTVILQGGNDLPKTPFPAKRSGELADNGIGSGFSSMWPPQDYEGMVDRITDLGLKIVTLTLQECEAPIDWSQPEYDIPPEFDNFITALAQNGIKISYVLSFWDKANHPEGWEGITSRFKTEEEIQRYLDYARFIVGRFKGRVQYYAVWSEADNCGDPVQCVRAVDMVNLIQRVAPVIREEYPEAKIVLPTNVIYYAPTYFDYMLNSEIMPLVDIVAWQTMPDFGPSDEDWRAFYSGYPSLVQEIKDTAYAHGFRGDYWASELDWWYPQHPGSPVPYPDSAIVEAKDHTRGIVMDLGLGVSVIGLGSNYEPAIAWPAVRNTCTIMAGATAVSVPVTLEGASAGVREYGFTLPNDGHTIVLWRDVEPVADDSGVPVTVTLAGFAGQQATGVDVLYGFEQELIANDESGNLVIHDLLVEDYPIILRLAPTGYVFLPTVLRGYSR